MSMDQVTVSLSRLALAKAIKTPDVDDPNGEPWTKSIIFHQSHIPQKMRESAQYPQQRHTRSRPQSRVILPPGMPIHHPRHIEQRQLGHENHNSRAVMQEGLPQSRSGQSSAVHPQPARQFKNNETHHGRLPLSRPHQNKKIEGHSPQDTSDQYSTDEDTGSEETCSNEMTTPKPKRPVSVPILGQPQRRSQYTFQLAIDGDDSDGETEREPTPIRPRPHSAHALEYQDHTQERRQSTLQQLEHGLSNQNRSHSANDMRRVLYDASRLHTGVGQPSHEQQEMYGMQTATYRISGSSGSAGGATPIQRPGSAELNTNYRPKSRELNAASTSPIEGRNRRSTLGEAELMYLHNQTQLQTHIQQYHQAAQPSPRASTPTHRPRMQERRKSTSNRLSMNAMDILAQREQDKAEILKKKPKKFDVSNAQIEGVLGRVPDKGLHSINFQSKKTPGKQQNRLSGSDFYGSSRQNPMPTTHSPQTRTKSTNYTYNQTSTDARRRAEMKRGSNEMEVKPTPSYSTPLSQPYPSFQPQMMPQGMYYGPTSNMSMMSLPHTNGMGGVHMGGVMPMMNGMPPPIGMSIQQSNPQLHSKKRHSHVFM